MAEVYEGLQESLNRRVAIKVMLPNIAKRRQMAKRFRREALALASLAHENIVAIHDLVEKNNQLFLITEFVDGVDIITLLKEQGALPLEVALLVGAGVARALEHAHFRRIVHRDIKPANVMLSRSGQVKLMDFGIAKDLTTEDLTRTGALVGTPSYLAPELLKGERPSPSADIYALGVLLFNCISGKKPFTANSPGELLGDIAAGRRRKIRDVAPDLPKAIAKLVEQCMALKPGDRMQTAALLRWELETHANRLVKTSGPERLINYLRECSQVTEEDLTGLALDKATVYETSPSRVLTKQTIELGDEDMLEVAEDGSIHASSTSRLGIRAARPGRWRRRMGAAVATLAIGGAASWILWPARVEALVHGLLGGRLF